MIVKEIVWGEPFHIHVDASNSEIGAVLGQKYENGAMHAIYYINKNLSPTERNYTTTEKGILVIVYEINKFRHCITGNKVFVYIDHATISYLMNKNVVGVWIIK